jgi:hypothetical protein
MIVLWNTIYIEAALEQLQKEGLTVRDENVALLLLLIHEHVNMLGTLFLRNAGHRGQRRTAPPTRSRRWKRLTSTFRLFVPFQRSRLPGKQVYRALTARLNPTGIDLSTNP